MRLTATVLLWLLTTAALAVAVPVGWAQTHLIGADGYMALAQSSARDPQLQDAVAALLTDQVVAFANDRGLPAAESVVRPFADNYTASPQFPGQFGRANRLAHEYLFTDSRDGTWQIDLAPMVSGTSFQDTLDSRRIPVPTTLSVPVTATPDSFPPGRYRELATWGPWVSIGAAVLAGVAAVLTVAVARGRGKALVALGVSALLVGAGGWAASELVRGRIDNALKNTEGNLHRIADVIVGNAADSLHTWLTWTLVAGGAPVVVGIVITVLGGARTRSVQTPVSARGTRMRART